MRIIAVGDVHGRDEWKEVRQKSADHIVFIGDYVDPHRPIPDLDVIDNLKAIIDFKKRAPDQTTLLVGNHDAQYLHYPFYPCSGHRADLQETYGRLFRENESLFQMAWQRGRFLFTHAGVSGQWYARHRSLLGTFEGGTLADKLNAVYRSDARDILFEVGRRRGGRYPQGGPVWADKSETQFDYLSGLGHHQVVGHSRVSDFERYGDARSSITFIDVFDTQVLFYECRVED